ncbi:RagB/SusD family nutrient uptake outer membrane protein [Sphingobacterium sp. SG20118]|uniref:RagB/SusD family nutrient uptake outer membrane protein n=1 Tax=Sphingobacterium sp. SG20118 TaxID=3367156 RepID=UPI0037DFC204
MKNKNIKILGAFVVLALSTLSCNQFLDVQSDSRMVVPSSIADLQKILDYNPDMNYQKGSKAEEMTDDYYLTEQNYNTLRDQEKLAYKWKPYESLNSSDWGNAYAVVYNANLVLDRLYKVNRTTENAVAWDKVKGTALFYRANQYLTLLWTYAKAYDEVTATQDLGIVLRNTSDFNVKSTRSTVEVCYRKVIDDLKQASGLIPELSLHVLQPKVKAAYGVLARAYLSMAKYDSAYYYADLVLGENPILLDFNQLVDVKPSADYPIEAFNKETVFYEEMMTGGFVFPSNADVPSELLQLYEANDLRKVTFFKSGTGGGKSFKGNYTGSNIWFSGIANNEMLMIRAECLARQMKVMAAQDDLNRLLKNRYLTNTFVPYVFANKEEALKTILHERRKELLFRGLRFIDIKRLNVEGSGIVLKRTIDGIEYQLNPNDKRYAHRLPDDVVRLAGMPQNSY